MIGLETKVRIDTSSLGPICLTHSRLKWGSEKGLRGGGVDVTCGSSRLTKSGAVYISFILVSQEVVILKSDTRLPNTCHRIQSPDLMIYINF